MLADVSSILGEHDVSIEALLQKDARPSDAQIVIVTAEVMESVMDAAVKELSSLEEVTSDITRIRLADF